MDSKRLTAASWFYDKIYYDFHALELIISTLLLHTIYTAIGELMYLLEKCRAVIGAMSIFDKSVF
jgi:hypothetical protein